MSKQKIQTALNKKNIPYERIEYQRGCVTPSGYANGWDIEITKETEDRLFSAGFKDCELINEKDTTEEVLIWIENMPQLEKSIECNSL